MIGKTVNWVVGRFTRILGSVTGTIKKNRFRAFATRAKNDKKQVNIVPPINIFIQSWDNYFSPLNKT